MRQILLLLLACFTASAPLAQEVVGLGFAFDFDADGRMIVSAVAPGGGAEAAGMQPGDAVLTINGAPMPPNNEGDPLRTARETPPVRLTVERPGETVALSLQPAPYEPRELLRRAAAFLCTSGDCVDGTGTLVQPNGRTYTGQFYDGLRDGEGVLTETDGRTYTGQFYENLRDGRGTFRWPDGSSWEGTFSRDAPQPPGIYTDASGARRPGLPDGTGTYTPEAGYPMEPRYGLGFEFEADREGRVIVMGVMPGGTAEVAGLRAGDVITEVDGQPLAPDPGVGPFVDALDDPPLDLTVARGGETLGLAFGPGPYDAGMVRRAARASGCLQGDCVEGYGVRVKPDGLWYEGEWDNGNAHGPGVMKDARGRVFVGTFVDDRIHGKGLLRWPDGSTWQGTFDRGSPDGLGTYTDASGESRQDYAPGAWV